MRRGKRLLAVLLAGTMICSAGSRYSSVMAFADDAESFVLSDENAESEKPATEEQKTEETVTEKQNPGESTAEEPETKEPNTAEPAVTENEMENEEDVTNTEENEKKCIASFNFDDSEQGLQGLGAKADVIDSSKSVILSDNGYHGRALYLDGTGNSALKVTKEDGNSLLTGVNELTVSYYSRPTDERTNWGFYAAASADAPKYSYERYLGVYETKENKVCAQRFHNSGSRPDSQNASADKATDGWHHIVAVFSAGETSTEQTENEQTGSRNYKVSIYIDGEKKAEEDNPYALTDVLGDSSILQIGKANWQNGEYYKGYIDEYSIYNYAMTEAEIRNSAVQPSEAEEFSKTLYFDNALSRLEGVEPDTSDGLDANGTEEIGLYYSYDNGKTWCSMSKVDANEGLGKQVSYVSLWKATVPETAENIKFRGWYKGYRRIITYPTGYRTSDQQKIPDDPSKNCYYGNPMVYQLDTSGTVLNGHWADVNAVNNIGQESVEVPEGTFTRSKDLYYGNSSFFDYYSDYELNGKKLSESQKTSEDEYNDQPLYSWNLALDRYYKEETSVKPLYFGGARMLIGNTDLRGKLRGYDGKLAGGNGFSGAKITTTGQASAFSQIKDCCPRRHWISQD